MSCGIYKIQNKINNKCYIGQSINIDRRWKEHKRKYYFEDTKFYRAIRKYGLENFEFSIIEECSPEDLDERENYWIVYYNTIEEGYNSLLSNQSTLNKECVLSETEFLILIDKIQNSDISFSELADEFHLTEGYIYQINRGIRRRRNYNYPLRNLNNSNVGKILDKETIDNVILDLKSYLFSFEDICINYNINSNTLQNINRGLHYHRDKEKYPIREDFVKYCVLTDEQVNEIFELLANSLLPITKIASKYNRSPSHIRNINIGKYHHKDNIQYPIRELQFHREITPDIRDWIEELLTDLSLTITKIHEITGVPISTISSINAGLSIHTEGTIYPIRLIKRRTKKK